MATMDLPNAIVCEICQQEFTQQSAYNKHLTCTHGIDDDLYPCKKCDKVFYKEKTLKEHTKNVHSANPKYKCTKEDCEKVFSNSVALSAHFKTHDKEFMCSFCAHTFSTKCNLQRHLRTHTGVKPYSCPHCPKKFAGASNLRMHLEVHEGIKEHACSLCNRHFNRKAHLKRHMIRYHKIEDWKSELIKDRDSSRKGKANIKVVKNNADLESDSDASDEDETASGNDLDGTNDGNQMTDGDEASPNLAFNITLATLEDCNIKGNRADGLIKCKKCQQKFKNELSFQNHLADTHGLQQPYCCSVCAQVFEDRQTLKEHAKQHKKTRIIKKQQLKQFKIDMEVKAESEKPAYNTSKIFPCSHCEEVCYSRSELNFHMNVHVENGDYVCKFCKAGFVKQYHLTKHMRQCQVKQMLKASRRAQRKSSEYLDNSDISLGDLSSDYIKGLVHNSSLENVEMEHDTSDNDMNNGGIENNIVDTNNGAFDENVVCEVVETEEVPLNAPLMTSYVQVQQDDHSYVQPEDRCIVTQQQQDVVVESNDGTQIWVIQTNAEQQEVVTEEPCIEEVETQQEEVEVEIDQTNVQEQVQYVEEQRTANQPQMVMVKDRNGRPMIVPVNLV